MFIRLVLLLAIVPLAELFVLVWIQARTSWMFTILLVLVTGVVGASLARWQGILAVRRIRDQLDRGQMPTDPLLDGLLILFAGVVLATPGVLTDCLGLLVLATPTRDRIREWLKSRIDRYLSIHATAHRSGRTADPMHRKDEIIDVRILDPPRDDREESLDSDT